MSTSAASSGSVSNVDKALVDENHSPPDEQPPLIKEKKHTKYFDPSADQTPAKALRSNPPDAHPIVASPVGATQKRGECLGDEFGKPVSKAPDDYSSCDDEKKEVKEGNGKSEEEMNEVAEEETETEEETESEEEEEEEETESESESESGSGWDSEDEYQSDEYEEGVMGGVVGEVQKPKGGSGEMVKVLYHEKKPSFDAAASTLENKVSKGAEEGVETCDGVCACQRRGYRVALTRVLPAHPFPLDDFPFEPLD
uniref:WGS project CAEQ00000000 data, annotated contig 397 n=1 Tax=Trypanosoma congolense (strain IL3000) TaxID=1068625 RepID=F9WFK7_TRYCI|nr:unnamed protein product [Trypanosoma congolense IL3000]